MPKKAKSRRVGLALLGCVALAALLFLSGGTRVYRGAQGDPAEVAASRAILEEMERRTPIDLDAEIKRQFRETLAAKNGILVDDLAAEQQKILAMAESGDVPDKATLARWFDGTALVGDSIVLSLREHGYLDAPIFAKIGIHLSSDLSLWDEIEAAAPSTIFLCFGMNDVSSFRERVNIYVERYGNAIRRLQASLPGVVIYVHAAFPVTAARQRKDDEYKYLAPYNEAMKAACPELGAYFIDSNFLLEARPDFYSPDGQHPIREFFPLWLTYIADLTGLSNE